MVELLQGLSPLQWVLIAGGLLMTLPTIKNLFANLVSKGTPIANLAVSSNNLTSIVHKWEVLNNACVEAGLEEAQGKLHEVFLVLANKKPDPKPLPPPVDKKDEEAQ